MFSINSRKDECCWKNSGRITKIRKVKNVEPANMSDIYKSSLLRTGIYHPINDMSDSGTACLCGTQQVRLKDKSCLSVKEREK